MIYFSVYPVLAFLVLTILFVHLVLTEFRLKRLRKEADYLRESRDFWCTGYHKMKDKRDSLKHWEKQPRLSNGRWAKRPD